MKHWFSDLPAFMRDPLDFFIDRGSNAREPLVKLRMGFSPVYLVTDAALVKPVMKASEQTIDKGRLIYKLREIIGQSSMVLSGERHRVRRAAIHQQLARGLATTYVPQLSAVIRRHAAGLANEEVFDAHHAMAPLAIRVICAILFGPDVLTPGDENALCESVRLVEDDLAAEMFKVVPDMPWVRRRKKAKLAEGRAIMSVVVRRAHENATQSSLLQALSKLDLTEEELHDEILLLLLAGHHTSGSAAAWLLYHLAADHDLCAAAAREARAVSDDAGEIRPDKLKDAALSLSIAREVLRLYPSAYWLSRETMQRTELAGIELKAGTSLIMSPWQLHRDPRYWDHPERFDVKRSYATPAYIPFGAGPRACVGMGVGLLELQLMCLEFASAYTFEVRSSVPAARPRPSVTLVPPPITLALRPRERVLPRRVPVREEHFQRAVGL
jgi:cytochrome P450